MPEHASRAAALFDQFEDEHRIADWGGDELFTRMPRPRAVDDAPAPRFRGHLALVEPVGDDVIPRSARAMHARADRLGLALVEPTHRFDESGAMIEPEPSGRRTKVITGHPEGAPRPLPLMRAERRRPARTPSDWIGARPERIVAWAFVLGLILILIAISTADAATL